MSCEFRMLLGYLIALSFANVALAELHNTAIYEGTTLKYYSGQQDTVIFAEAILACSKKRGELVMPKDKDLNTVVATVSQGHLAWIGGGDLRAENLFEWNDGDEIEWANWGAGQPDDSGNEDCMIINYKNKGAWNDQPCCDAFGFVCQMQGSRSQPFEYSVLNVYGRADAQSNADAKEFCRQRGSRLVSIESNEQLVHLKKALKRSTKTLTTYWVDYKTIRKNTCSIVSGNSIHTSDCLSSLPFICEAVQPHDLTVSNETPEALEGSDLKIDCSARGFPFPSVAWYKDDVFLPKQDRGEASSTLTLENLSQSDSGLYVCRAVNEIAGRSRQMEGYSILKVFGLDNN